MAANAKADILRTEDLSSVYPVYSEAFQFTVNASQGNSAALSFVGESPDGITLSSTGGNGATFGIAIPDSLLGNVAAFSFSGIRNNGQGPYYDTMFNALMNGGIQVVDADSNAGALTVTGEGRYFTGFEGLSGTLLLETPSWAYDGSQYDWTFTFYSIPDASNVVPEPATLAVFGLGLAGLGLARARRKK